MSDQNSCQTMDLPSRMLLMAVKENMPKTISALLQEGADIETKGPDGYTAFLLSAYVYRLRKRQDDSPYILYWTEDHQHMCFVLQE